ncbi:sodium/potassium-transporting ATPase subunit beta-2 isoform X2 [Leptonychotes weddellii]|uniref:Sodium/potassium-transporting ATPase subunit beta n=1 Tax=Leptonychotes weddellii TaxID=9713 RepID=A0A7F8R9C5_LEPWE|nr:sodium/potassium-transporting ATPase subunit beta-2 isoform X2 [Leptonychotes weddellii]
MVIQKEKKSCGQVVEEWKEFVWNPRTHQFMGRTGTSWAFILLFYLVFYGFLTAMFTLTMWVMLQTVSDHTPKYQDRLATPGLMIRPKTENLDVIVNVSDAESWDQHVQKLNKFLEPYNDSIQAQKNDVCRPGRYYEQPDNGVLNYPKRACQFNRTQLGNCSGLGDPTHYGYSTGQPCVFIKMNRVINFYAGANQSMNVTCVGKRPLHYRDKGVRVGATVTRTPKGLPPLLLLSRMQELALVWIDTRLPDSTQALAPGFYP